MRIINSQPSTIEAVNVLNKRENPFPKAHKLIVENLHFHLNEFRVFMVPNGGHKIL